MKYFVIEITYKIPVENLGDLLTRHRAHLQVGYDKGLLLYSGPQEPRIGGIILARSGSIEEIKAFFALDPYVTNKVAGYRFIEFKPVKHQEFLKDWI